MSQPYSKRLYLGHAGGLGRTAALYTAPAGKVVIVRQIDWYTDAIRGGALSLGINVGAENYWLWTWFVESSYQGAANFGRYSYGGGSWEGRQVMNAGDRLMLQNDVQPPAPYVLDLSVSGYEL